MSLKKEFVFEIVITIILWGIYAENLPEDIPNFGLNSFLFGAPYFLTMIKGTFLTTGSSIGIPETIFIIYSGLLLLCAFCIMVEYSPVVYVGFGSIFNIPISSELFSLLLLPLGGFQIYKLF